ncbi:MAG: phage tail protein [Luteolibacter sp.]
MANSPFIGEIRMFGLNFSPRNWSFCNGQLISIASNTALFSLLGTQYGGNGTTTFALPDLRGRTPLNQGNGPGLSLRVIGQTGGVENVTLGLNEMPAHTHAAQTAASAPCKNSAGNSDTPAGNYPSAGPAEIFSGTSNGSMGAMTVTGTLGASGGSQPHTNLPPFLCVNFCIALQGIFPSRN